MTTTQQMEIQTSNSPRYFVHAVLGAEELLHIASAFPEAALQLGMGTGDLAILEAYRKYKREYGRFIQVSIWSLDKHLKAYEE